MKDYIEIIKNNFFSSENIDFIYKILRNKNCIIQSSHINIFNACNTIFNQFIQTVYSQKKIINPNTIEELLVTLNKMTIELIINENQENQENNISQDINNSQNTPLNPYENKIASDKVKNEEEKLIQNIQKQDENQKAVVNISNNNDNIKENNSSLSKYIEPLMSSKKVYIFSEDTIFNDGKYNFEMKDYFKVKLVSFELLNNLYNITENNNTFEIIDKNIKKRINIPIGCYKLNDLIDNINDKLKSNNIKMSLSPYKNRISITRDNPFSFNFIENENLFIPLRFMLGFSNKEYLNNNNYVSNKDPVLNIYDNIYIKIESGNDCQKFNTKSSQNFTFYERIISDQLNTFGQDISFKVPNSNFITTNFAHNGCNISLELYYRHSSHNKFYKIHQKLQFLLIFDVLIKEESI